MKVIYCLAVLSVFIHTGLFARSWHINIKDSHLELEVDSEFSSSLEEGDHPVIQGHFCLRKDKNGNQCKLLTPEDLSKYEVKFFYPDITNDVSNSVIIKIEDDRHTFEFQTPDILSTDKPQFIAEVINKGSKVTHYQKALVKVQTLIEKLLSRQTHCPKDARKHVDKYIITLRKIEARIKTKLNGETALIAKREFPFQVKNNISKSSGWINATEEWQVGVDFSLGANFEGEKSWVDLAFVPYTSNDEDWKFEFKLDGSLIKEKEVLSPATPFLEKLLTDSLAAGDHDLELIISRREKKDHGKHDKWDKTFKRKFVIRTLEDQVLPEFSNMLPIPGRHVSKNSHSLSYTVFDRVGRVNEESIKAVFELEDGTVLDLSSSLNYVTNAEALVPSIHGSQAGSSGYSVSGTFSNLPEGIHKLTLKMADFAGNEAQGATWDLVYDRTSPLIETPFTQPYITKDEAFTFPVIVTDRTKTNLKIYVNGIVQFEAFALDGNFSDNVNVNFTVGENLVLIEATDEAGNISKVNLSTIVRTPPDTLPPMIQLAVGENILTNVSMLNLPISVTDESATTTSIWHNGINVYSTASTSFNFNLTLTEGINLLLVQSVDAYGNESSVQLSNIMLDTAPPQLASISPANGQVVYQTVNFEVRGTSNEKLSAAYINGASVPLSSGGFSFNSLLSTFAEGELTYEVKLVDFVGNEATFNMNIEIINSVLNKNLITINPLGEANKLTISGTAGAARAGIEIKATVGFFNSEIVISNPDGSFEIIMDYFTSVTLTGKDESINKEESHNFTFMADTTLSGVVKDNQNNPLPGIKVIILSSGQSATTDSAGTFQILEPAGGDQKIVIDPANIPLEIVGEGKQYFQTVVGYNIGKTQLNVLPPIYLNPLIKDGSQTQVSSTSLSVVTGPHAPGFEMTIPAGVAKFPTGLREGEISVAEIPGDRLTVPTPEFATPETVYALEPSGLKFDSPVEVILPNPNGFPAGMNLLIMSKNSISGIWEVDGVAEVDEGGSEIRTKEGMGITHFSEIFAVPVLPTLSPQTEISSSSADIVDDNFSMELPLPSYKSLNRDRVLGLKYKSNWAKPLMLMKHFINYDNKIVTKTSQNVYYVSKGKLVNDETTATSLGLDYAEFYFESNNIQTPVRRFGGVPDNTVISYAVDVSDMQSGIYPYYAHLNMAFREITVGTRKLKYEQRYKKNWWGGWGTYRERWTEHYSYATVFNELIPQDLAGPMIVSNKKSSPYGKGWKLNGHQELLNVDGPRIALEEGNGDITQFNIDRRMITIAKDVTNGMQSASLASLPTLIYSTANGDIKRLDTSSSGPPASNGSFPSRTGNFTYYAYDTLLNGVPYGCYFVKTVWNVSAKGGNIVPLANGNFLSADSMNGIVNISNSTSSYLVGGVTKNATSRDMTDFDFSPYVSTETGGRSSTCSGTAGSGVLPKVGNVNGSFSVANFNAPYDLLNLDNGNFLVSDKGNNQVKIVNTNSSTVSLFAGTGSTYDQGDGGQAISASMYHPQGLAKDNSGNIFISTERGLIRKIDSFGNISHVAGKSQSEGGVFSDSTSVELISFSNPVGLAFDNENNALFVSDMGRNRIVRLDFDTNKAETVAGSGTCGSGDVDDVLATAARLCSPSFIHLDTDGNLIVLDKGNSRVRKLLLKNAGLTDKTFASSNPNHGILKKLANGTWVRFYKDGSIASYNSNGKITSIQSRDGLTFQYKYSDNFLTQIIDEAGLSTSLSYDSNGMLASIIDPADRETTFSHGGNGELLGVNYQNISEKYYNYDAVGRATEIVDELNNKTEILYNTWGRIRKIIYPDASSKEFNNSEENSIVSLDDVGNEVQSDLLKVGNGDSNINLQIKDGNGNISRIINGENGLPKEIVLPNGESQKFEYDSFGRVIKSTSHDLSYILNTYNDAGDKIEVFNSSTGILLTNTFNDYGQITTEKENGQLISSLTYDPSSGRLLSLMNSLNETTMYTYNSLGMVVQASSGGGLRIINSYDSKGNLSSISNLGNTSNSYTRDVAGNISSKSDSKGNRVTYQVDTFNRITSVKTAEAQADKTTAYHYNLKGELITITDPLGGITRYNYDAGSRVIRKINPNGKIYEWTYDQNGNMLTQTDPLLNVTTFFYDEKNRLIKKVMPDDEYNYVFDNDNNLAHVSNSTSELNLDYIKNGGSFRVSSTSLIGKSILNTYPQINHAFSYDSHGNRTQFSSSHGDMFLTFDSENKLRSLQSSNDSFNYNYDSSARFSGYSNSNSNLSLSLSINSANQITTMNYSRSGSSLTSMTYGYDAAGLISSFSYGGAISSIYHDAKNQLASVISTQGNEDYSYDEVGNRTLDASGPYSYDPSKQLLEEDYKYIYTFDANGNMVGRQEKGFTGNVTNYSYNTLNKLIKVEVFNTSVKTLEVFFSYDVLGRRLEKKIIDSSSGITRSRKYEYDGNEIIAVYNGENQILARYTASYLKSDDVLAVEYTSHAVSEGMSSAAGKFYYIKDSAGSIREIRNSAGTLIQKIHYSGFGEIINVTNSAGLSVTTNPPQEIHLAFSGREFDSETGLYFYRARFYDPKVGRFITSDPDAGEIKNPQSFNSKYIYAENNPFNLSDPSGQRGLSITIGSFKFNSSGKSLLAGVLFPPSLFLRPFLNSHDNNIMDSVIITTSVVVVAAYVSPGTAAVAVVGTIIGNTGKGGNVLDELDNYTIQFSMSYALGLALGGDSLSEEAIMNQVAFSITMRLGEKLIVDNLGEGTWNTILGVLFISTLPRIYRTYGVAVNPTVVP